jgi:hypothetical protein
LNARDVAFAEDVAHLLVRLCVVDAQHARPDAEQLVDDVVRVADEQRGHGDELHHAMQHQQAEEAEHPLILALAGGVVKRQMDALRPLHGEAIRRIAVRGRHRRRSRGRISQSLTQLRISQCCCAARDSLCGSDLLLQRVSLFQLDPLQIQNALH